MTTNLATLRFEVETEAIVHCTGRITSNTTKLLRAIVKPLIVENKAVVLDLSNVDYMDSSGLGTIIALYVSAKVNHCSLTVVNLNHRLKELFSITKLGDVLTKLRDPNIPGVR